MCFSKIPSASPPRSSQSSFPCESSWTVGVRCLLRAVLLSLGSFLSLFHLILWVIFQARCYIQYSFRFPFTPYNSASSYWKILNQRMIFSLVTKFHFGSSSLRRTYSILIMVFWSEKVTIPPHITDRPHSHEHGHMKETQMVQTTFPFPLPSGFLLTFCLSHNYPV